MPGTPHLLLISADAGALVAWRRSLAEAGVIVAGALAPAEAPLRLRALRPSMLVVIEPATIREACETVERCRSAAEFALPALLLLAPSSPWLRAPLPPDLAPAGTVDASLATGADVVRAARLLMGDEAEVEAIVVGGIALDRMERRLRGPAGDVFLTPSEATLLATLLDRPREVVRVPDVARALWGTPLDDTHARAAIRTHLHTLRRKLGAVGASDAVRSVTGVGYRLEAGAVDEAR